MLSIFFLNVGHGDSIVLRLEEDGEQHFAVVDSNSTDPTNPPALTKLRELGAQRLSFVALTHPHRDHFTGLPAILNSYRGAVSSFYSFPLQSERPDRLRKLAEIYRRVAEDTDSPTIRSAATEFVRLMHAARHHVPEWLELTGPWNRVFPIGFGPTEIHALLPPAKVKGEYFQQLDKGSLDVIADREKENDLSVAFSIKYRGVTVVLGGDGTESNWMDQKRQLRRGSDVVVAARAVKLPHHGSRIDSSPKVLGHLFATDGDRVACISANGRSHPHPTVYAELQRQGVMPYCTNLATQCGAVLRPLVDAPDLEPALRKFVNVAGESELTLAPQPCQGTVELRIDDTGHVDVHREHAHPCWYRGELAFLPQ